MSADENTNLVLIVGESSTGKSASLMNLKNPEGVLYLNCENNKRLPFKSKFGKEYSVTDPMVVPTIIADLENRPEYHTAIVDTLTMLMDMFESKYVLTSSDTRQAWQYYQQYFKNMMQDQVAKSSKNLVFLAHTANFEDPMTLKSVVKVPVKGALARISIEASFSSVIACKRVLLKDLEPYENDLLTITPDDEALGYKHVYQVRLTKDTVNERIRSPMGMWDIKETYINNDLQLVLDRLHSFYS